MPQGAGSLTLNTSFSFTGAAMMKVLTEREARGELWLKSKSLDPARNGLKTLF